VASPPAACPLTACRPVAASRRMPTFPFVMGRDGGPELVIRGACVHRKTTVLSNDHVGGRIGVEEPLYAEPPHDTTAHLLGERGQSSTATSRSATTCVLRSELPRRSIELWMLSPCAPLPCRSPSSSRPSRRSWLRRPPLPPSPTPRSPQPSWRPTRDVTSASARTLARPLPIPGTPSPMRAAT